MSEDGAERDEIVAEMRRVAAMTGTEDTTDAIDTEDMSGMEGMSGMNEETTIISMTDKKEAADLQIRDQTVISDTERDLKLLSRTQSS